MRWPRRYSVLGLLSLAYLLCYVARMAMPSAIPFIADEFKLSPILMGEVMSAFFVGYALMQIPGGMITDRFGPNRVLTVAIAFWSFFTAVSALAGSATLLIIFRVLFGASEAPFPAAAAKALTNWFPPEQIGRANGIMLASTQLGASLAPAIVGLLVIEWGWRAAFLVLLPPGLLIGLLMQRWVKDRPADGEAAPIPAATKPTLSETWRPLLKPAVLWCFAAAFCSNLAAYGLFSWLPTYLLRARGFSVERMAVFTSLPYLAGALGYFLSGQISDRYFRHKRHMVVPIGLVLSAAFTLAAGSAANGEQAVALLAPAFLFLAIADAGINTLPMVIVPHDAIGATFGLVNSAAQLAGFLSPLLVGAALSATGDDFPLIFRGFVGALILAAAAASQIRQSK